MALRIEFYKSERRVAAIDCAMLGAERAALRGMARYGADHARIVDPGRDGYIVMVVRGGEGNGRQD
jgi:hypothetical protein